MSNKTFFTALLVVLCVGLTLVGLLYFGGVFTSFTLPQPTPYFYENTHVPDVDRILEPTITPIPSST